MRASWSRHCAGFVLSCLAFSPLTLSTASASFQAQFGLGPDNNQALLLKTIASAKTRLRMNAYDFTHGKVADAVIASIQRGVTFELLLETQPFKNPLRAMSTEGKKLTVRIFEAMKASNNPDHRIYLMGSNVIPYAERQETKVKRRFNFNHAKYVIADDAAVLVSSENFTDTGHPNAKTQGNRGWDIVVTDPATVKKFADIFANDRQTEAKDVLEVTITGRLPGFITKVPVLEAPSQAQIDERIDESMKPDPAPVREPLAPIGSGRVDSIQVLTSPKALPALEAYMQAAKKSLDLQFMSLPSRWFAGRNPYANPLVERLIRLARAGVQVRALLNDDRVFEDPGTEAETANEITVDYLNELARCHGISIAAKVVDTQALEITYIHNKGMIVDGRKVLVSSINGSRNSVQNNREAAISLEGEAAGRYFGRAFSHDWEKSQLQTLTKAFTSCPDLPGTQQGAFTAFVTPWTQAF